MIRSTCLILLHPATGKLAPDVVVSCHVPNTFVRLCRFPGKLAHLEVMGDVRRPLQRGMRA
ncbi:MAG: hypothetical protein KDD83_20095, partial [Caldilineaceae bacterium]|nr:hypothetical protein [Caldilineaceae bacterium]